jgi:UDP-N-acetylglucosamine:LPS N-acetylglucosamine transferase
MVRDNELTGPVLRALLDEMLGDPARLEAMRASALRLAMPDAADRIADELAEAAA